MPLARWARLRYKTTMSVARVLLVACLMSVAVLAQSPTDPFLTPMPASEAVVRVGFVEFAASPDVGGTVTHHLDIDASHWAPASRTDLRFAAGPDDRVFILNKHDGVVRLLVPDANASR